MRLKAGARDRVTIDYRPDMSRKSEPLCSNQQKRRCPCLSVGLRLFLPSVDPDVGMSAANSWRLLTLGILSFGLALHALPAMKADRRVLESFPSGEASGLTQPVLATGELSFGVLFQTTTFRPVWSNTVPVHSTIVGQRVCTVNVLPS